MEREESCGQRQCLTARDKRAMIASNSSFAARQISEEAEVATNVSNVRRLLKNSEHRRNDRNLVRSKSMSCAVRSFHRNTFIRIKDGEVPYLPMKRDSIWTDSMARRCYYRDLRKEQQLSSRRRHGRRRYNECPGGIGY